MMNIVKLATEINTDGFLVDMTVRGEEEYASLVLIKGDWSLRIIRSFIPSGCDEDPVVDYYYSVLLVNKYADEFTNETEEDMDYMVYDFKEAKELFLRGLERIA